MEPVFYWTCFCFSIVEWNMASYSIAVKKPRMDLKASVKPTTQSDHNLRYRSHFYKWNTFKLAKWCVKLKRHSLVNYNISTTGVITAWPKNQKNADRPSLLIPSWKFKKMSLIKYSYSFIVWEMLIRMYMYVMSITTHCKA